MLSAVIKLVLMLADWNSITKTLLLFSFFSEHRNKPCFILNTKNVLHIVFWCNFQNLKNCKIFPVCLMEIYFFSDNCEVTVQVILNCVSPQKRNGITTVVGDFPYFVLCSSLQTCFSFARLALNSFNWFIYSKYAFFNFNSLYFHNMQLYFPNWAHSLIMQELKSHRGIHYIIKYQWSSEYCPVNFATLQCSSKRENNSQRKSYSFISFYSSTL